MENIELDVHQPHPLLQLVTGPHQAHTTPRMTLTLDPGAFLRSPGRESILKKNKTTFNHVHISLRSGDILDNISIVGLLASLF